MKTILIAVALLGSLVTDARASNGGLCTDPHTGHVYQNGGTYPMTASHYGAGDGFHGKQTASGIIFNKDDPTMVAHKVLPLGTKILLTYSGKSAEAVVVDDGPHPAGRDLDASAALAKTLGFFSRGITERDAIEVTVLDMSDEECRDDGKGLR